MEKYCLAAGLLAALVVAMCSGCTAIATITAATKEKTVAAGSDTWGGGAEVAAATVDQPVPSGNFWFGRRKVWYTSIKDAATGNATAAVVKASNSSITAGLSTSGITVEQGAEEVAEAPKTEASAPVKPTGEVAPPARAAKSTPTPQGADAR